MDISSTTNVVIFLALPEEHDEFLAKYPAVNDISDELHVILEHSSDIEGYRIFSVLSVAMGDAESHIATQKAITKLKADLVVCIGIAGSLSSDLKIGDVAVSNEIIDISQNIKISERKVPSRRKGRKRPAVANRIEQLIELSPKTMPVSNLLSASFRFVRSHPLLSQKHINWINEANTRRKELLGDGAAKALREEFEIRPAVEIGPIISGPVVASSAFKKMLKSIDRKVLAVETESAGIFRACSLEEVPCVTVRGVSDHADIDKNALERTTKSNARALACRNAIEYVSIQLSNPKFMAIASNHLAAELSSRNSSCEPEIIMSETEKGLDSYLDSMSPEYKHRPNNTNLPIPRIKNETVEENLEDTELHVPKVFVEALASIRRIYVKIPKSFPNQTLAWSVAQVLLKGELDGKQILPIAVAGDEINPPNKGLLHAAGFDPNDPQIKANFTPVIVLNEPPFQSKARMAFLIDDLKSFDLPIVVISRAEYPTKEIDKLKTELSLVDHGTAPVPFVEIANYLEAAFAMEPEEADTVAARLNDTFSKFRLHTHPAYFVGLQETTIEALIQANQRAELIQLAVDGLLSFVVAFDESPVKLSRTTREEFLSELALSLKVSGDVLNREALESRVREFAERKSLEVQPSEFLRGFFAVGLLHESGGKIAFSVPYLEAYLIAEKLKTDSDTAKSYFDPNKDEFDHFSFDLYVEKGADAEVIQNVSAYAKYAISLADEDENVFSSKDVEPRALGNPQMLVQFSKKLVSAAAAISSPNEVLERRSEKQRLLDARSAVSDEVATRKKREVVPKGKESDFDRLDRLTRSSVLLSTMIGSGAERLDGVTKKQIGAQVLTVFERLVHLWTKERMQIDFDNLRNDLLEEESIDRLLEELEAYAGSKEEITENLSTFIDDQEMRLLSGPLGALFSRIAQYAGVRSLRPVLSKLEPRNEMERILRDVWFMDVEHNDGKRRLKAALQSYKGSPLLRLVVTNHLLYRIFWHHWERESKSAFVDVARYSLAPMGLKPDEAHAQKMLSGNRAPKRQSK